MSVYIELLENRGTNFQEIILLGGLLEFLNPFKFWLKSDKNNGQFIRNVFFSEHLERNLLYVYQSEKSLR
jgi:hypothetical protein